MTPSSPVRFQHHIFVWVLALLISAGAGMRGVRVHAAGAPPDQVRLIASANVTLRQSPNASALIAAYVPLGTEVTDVGPAGMDKTWVHVALADHRDGWVLASLTRPIMPGRRWPAIERVIAERLQRRGDSFATAVELTDFVERVAVAASDPEEQARLDAYRLPAVALALGAMPSRQSTREPYLSWLDRHRDVATYDEPGGRWILANQAIWAVHDKHATSPVADDLAWLAATNGLAGECEGSVACYFDWRNRLEGEYLRKHPSGRHAAEAIAVIKDTADRLRVPPKATDPHVFDRAHECGPLTTTIEALRTSITGSTASTKDGAVASLGELRAWCK